MLEIFNFLLSYWKPILGVVLCIVSLVIACIRKRPVTDILSDLYTYCMLAVLDAEGTELKGDSKRDYAFDYVKNALLEKYPNLDITQYKATIYFLIEKILSTPQRKEKK